MSDLVIRGLSKSYGQTLAVNNLDLELHEGELLAILGPSGCGKSTLLSCIAGILTPDCGEIFLGNRTLFSSKTGTSAPPEQRNMGVVYQSYALWPHMRTAVNIAYPLKVRRRPAEEIRKETARILKLLKLEGKEHRFPTELSGGEQQRVALGRALIMQPELLLMDEPLSNLDARLRETMQEEIRRLQQTLDLTIIHVTHDQGEAMAMSDRITVMSEGSVLQTGTPREIYSTPVDPFVADFVGTNNLIKGEIMRKGNNCFLRCINDELLPLPGNGEPAGTALYAVRPEDLIFSPEEKDPDSGTLLPRGTVVSRIFRGAHLIYTLDFGGCTFRVQTHSDREYSPGTQIPFRIRKAVRIR